MRQHAATRRPEHPRTSTAPSLFRKTSILYPCHPMAGTPSGTSLRINTLIGGRFKVLQKLGAGGTGVVYLCKDQGLSDQDSTKLNAKDKTRNLGEVAIKLLMDLRETARFMREIRVMRKVHHPNVIACKGHGLQPIGPNMHPYLIMEFAPGGSLHELLRKRKGRLPPAEACWVIEQAVKGLRASHTVHRDLKPENLLLDRAPESPRADLTRSGIVIKVADFGLAKVPDEQKAVQLTRTSQVMGTPMYMSPEQCSHTKRVKQASDIYSLGVILYEMLAGRPPFDSPDLWVLMGQHVNDKPDLSLIPAAVRPVVATCLAKQPKERYRSLAALERDLGRIQVGLPPGLGGGGSMRLVLILLVAALAAGTAGWILRDEIRRIIGSSSAGP